MVQDPNVERVISEAIAPLTKEIKELKRQIKALKQVNEFAIPAVSNCYADDCLIQSSCSSFKTDRCNKECKLYA